MSTGANGTVYEVQMSMQTKAHLKQLHLQEALAGRGAIFVTAFREIIHRLQNNPWEFGEPLFHLPALKLQIRKAAILPLIVDFGVHEEKLLVFIRGFKTLS